jgi:hypothetical protein
MIGTNGNRRNRSCSNSLSEPTLSRRNEQSANTSAMPDLVCILGESVAGGTASTLREAKVHKPADAPPKPGAPSWKSGSCMVDGDREGGAWESPARAQTKSPQCSCTIPGCTCMLATMVRHGTPPRSRQEDEVEMDGDGIPGQEMPSKHAKHSRESLVNRSCAAASSKAAQLCQAPTKLWV